jgi:hypothetical protein
MSSIQEWWDSLSSKERAATRKSAADGTLDAATRQSLEDAGVLKKGSTSGDDDAVTFLKMRHD